MSETPTKTGSLDISHDEGDHDEELWLMSYADMVTLLFGFFVILYSFSSLDEKKFDQMSEKVAEAFQSKGERKESDTNADVTREQRQIRALQMLIGMLNLGDSVDEAVQMIEKSFAQRKAEDGTKTLIAEKIEGRDYGLVQSVKKSDSVDIQTVELILPATTLFSSGGHRLSDEATAKLHELADDLRQAPDLAEIEVVGHTDGKAPGRGAIYDSNFTLSSLRAGAVAAALIRFGIDPKRVSVRGMGSLKPLVPERDGNGRPIVANMAKNRRVGILLKMRRAHVPAAH
jgi:chemotaxis protein MotB